MRDKRDMHPTDSVTSGELSPRQAAFVREYVERGGRAGSAASAAQAAGYGRPGRGGRAAARVRASELLRQPKVLEALRAELTRKLSAGAALGVGVLIELAQSGPPNVRLAAAKELVDRGYGPITSRNAHVHVGATLEEALARIAQSEDDAPSYSDGSTNLSSEL
ncbi:MAG: hypothetical protein QM698_09165 [Micropepsaceae bacterium]